MSRKKRRDRDESPEQRRESGQPGGGAGRRDEVGGSGVYPASAGNAPEGAEIRTQAGWGQGERGAAPALTLQRMSPTTGVAHAASPATVHPAVRRRPFGGVVGG